MNAGDIAFCVVYATSLFVTALLTYVALSWAPKPMRDKRGRYVASRSWIERFLIAQAPAYCED